MFHFISFPGSECYSLSFAPGRITPAVKQSLESIAQSETYGVGRSIESEERRLKDERIVLMR